MVNTERDFFSGQVRVEVSCQSKLESVRSVSLSGDEAGVLNARFDLIRALARAEGKEKEEEAREEPLEVVEEKRFVPAVAVLYRAERPNHQGKGGGFSGRYPRE